MNVKNIILSDIDDNPVAYQGKGVAVHIHLFYLDLIPEFVGYLKNIPTAFDLYLSIPETIKCDEKQIRESFMEVANIRDFVIKRTPNRGRDIAPMLCSFNSEIKSHDLFLHFHSKKTPEDKRLAGWRNFMLNHLLGSEKIVSDILSVLTNNMGMVCAPDYNYVPNFGWDSPNNINEAQKIIATSPLTIDLETDFKRIPFPQGTFFWARTDFLENFFALGLTYEDFPAEPIPNDGTIAHALERLFFLWGINTRLLVGKLYITKEEFDICSHLQNSIEERDIKAISNENRLLNLYREQEQKLWKYQQEMEEIKPQEKYMKILKDIERSNILKKNITHLLLKILK